LVSKSSWLILVASFKSAVIFGFGGKTISFLSSMCSSSLKFGSSVSATPVDVAPVFPKFVGTSSGLLFNSLK
jgi:ApbE superfamily uncharacterized protein (UPF0280 family)